jgi:hypothetical protein
MLHRLPQEWIAILTQRLRRGGKTWADFNDDRRYYDMLVGFVDEGLIVKSDLPPEPDPVNYP